MKQMHPQLGHILLAAGWTPAYPLPDWLGSKAQSNSKVRLLGKVDALYLEHQRLVVQTRQNDLIWVFFDRQTRFLQMEEQHLQAGQKLQIDGFLINNRLQATQIKLLSQVL